VDERLTYWGGVKFLRKYFMKHKRNFLLFYVGWFVDSVLTVITPIIFAIMIDQIVYYNNLDVFLRVSLVFALMSLFSCIHYFLIYTFHHYLMSMYIFDIRMDLFNKIQSLNAVGMSQARTGDLISTILYDTEECMHFIIRNILHSFNAVLKGVFYIVYIFIISSIAGFAIALFLPLVAYMTFKFGNRIRSYSDNQREIYGGYASWLFEILRGLAEIRLLTAEKMVRRKFVGFQRDLFRLDIKTRFANLTSNQVIEGVNLLLQLAIFGICAYLAFIGEMTIGSVIVLVTFTFALKDQCIAYLVQNIMAAQYRLTRIARIKRFMAMEDERSWKGTNELAVTRGDIRFENVHFAYDSRKPVLRGLSHAIPGGRHVAIVGRSGCGKTTVASLLIGMYEWQAGSIAIDGQNLASCDLKSIRRNIGIVQQDVLIFDATIRENLLLGNPKASEEEIWDACRKAGISAFIEALPDRLDTRIGKGGIGLSGGQKQRIAIARIYLKNPAIIVFDEATSALDPETEERIHDAWKELLQGRTAIVIAHRLSSVMLCDHCILIEDGVVREEGHPERLLKTSEPFRKLFAIHEVAAGHVH
jgi:ABC-type multidrug transport system fused ATPase/permease subunit